MTAAHIRRVMQEMGYEPRRNKLRRAREERSDDIQFVGVLFPDTNKNAADTPLAKKLVDGVRNALAENKVEVGVFTLDEDWGLPKEIVSSKHGGLVVRSGSGAPGGDEAINDRLQALGIPAIWTLGGALIDQNVDQVRMDDRGCGLTAAKMISSGYSGRVFGVKPEGKPNLDIEMRALAFSFRLNANGITDSLEFKYPKDILRSIKSLRKPADITVFVPGNDSTVEEVHEEIASVAVGRGHRIRIIAVMTSDTDIKALEGETIDTLHIDPYRIGITAGRQLIWRYHYPWAEPSKVLVPVKEVADGGR